MQLFVKSTKHFSPNACKVSLYYRSVLYAEIVLDYEINVISIISSFGQESINDQFQNIQCHNPQNFNNRLNTIEHG